MNLITFHKVLIAFAVAFFLFFGIREIIREGGNVFVASVVLVLAAVAAIYFAWVLRGGYSRKE